MKHSSKSVPVLPAFSTQSPDAFIQSLETITAYIKEYSLKASQPPQAFPFEYNQYYSDNDSALEFDSENYTDHDSEYDSDYCYGELATPEQEVPPPPSSKKELESIATICEEATSTKQIVRKPEAPVRELTEDLKKFFYDIPSSSDNTANNTANLFAINSPFNNIGFSGTSLSNDFISTQTFDNSIYVFIDNSNILAGFKAICQTKLGKRRQKGKKMPMLDYIELFKIIEKGRNVKRKFLAASKPLFQPLTQAELAGYECAALQRINQKNNVSTSLSNFKSVILC